ncbi:MAG TPA: YqzL family protein [bacterium]|nr:YqzL family protein [bacterium]
MEITWTPEFFWRVFETTGSVWAYLLYRQLTKRPPRWVIPILN